MSKVRRNTRRCRPRSPRIALDCSSGIPRPRWYATVSSTVASNANTKKYRSTAGASASRGSNRVSQSAVHVGASEPMPRCRSATTSSAAAIRSSSATKEARAAPSSARSTGRIAQRSNADSSASALSRSRRSSRDRVSRLISGCLHRHGGAGVETMCARWTFGAWTCEVWTCAGLGLRASGVRGLGLRASGVRELDVRGVDVRSLDVRGFDVRSLDVRRFAGAPFDERDVDAALSSGRGTPRRGAGLRSPYLRWVCASACVASPVSAGPGCWCAGAGRPTRRRGARRSRGCRAGASSRPADRPTGAGRTGCG